MDIKNKGGFPRFNVGQFAPGVTHPAIRFGGVGGTTQPDSPFGLGHVNMPSIPKFPMTSGISVSLAQEIGKNMQTTASRPIVLQVNGRTLGTILGSQMVKDIQTMGVKVK
jgi:hypothetical protein